MMCCNPGDLRDMADWPGKGAESRTKLIEKLQGLFHSNLTITISMHGACSTMKI